MSIDELLEPIAGDNPAGVYLRYDPVYDQIKEARREDDDLPQGDWETARKVADWPLVIRLSSEAIAQRSKDLQLAAWLAEAQLRKDGIGGLRSGLELVGQLLERFWEHLHPEIDDGDAEMRAAPLEWMGLKFDVAARMAPLTADDHSLVDYRALRTVPTEAEAEEDSDKQAVRARAIEEGRLTPEEFERSFQATPKSWYEALVEDLDACLTLVAGIDTFGDERFGDVAPSWLPLRGALQEVRQVAAQLLARKRELEPDTQSAVEASAPPGSAPAGDTPVSSAGASPAPAVSPSGAAPPAGGPRTADEAGTWIAAAATRLRAEQPASPAPYLLVRGYRWGELRAGGGSIDPRLLAAPTTETRTRMKGLLLDARWAELVEAGEAVMATVQGRGWLDLQRYILTGLDGLGGDYEVVRSALHGQLRMLLRDLPELPSLTLMDDSPTANAETLAWLRQENILEGEDQEDGNAEVPAVRRRPTMQRDPWDVARERARSGDARGAMELLMREASQEESERARFLRRSQAAEIMVGAGMEPVAMPILREMLERIETHRLEEWEAGETVAQPLGLLYQCITRLESDEVDRRDLYVRICRLDPVQAVRLGDDGPGPDEGA